MGSLSRDQASIPGPGAYEANPNAVKDKVKGSIFGKVIRESKIAGNSQAPGPGSY